MRHLLTVGLSMIIGVAFTGVILLAVERDNAIDSKWWPSEWGPDDQRGAMNRITTEKVLGAANLVKKGDIYQLGRLYEQGMPLRGQRHFKLTIPGSPTGVAKGEYNLVWHDEMVTGELGQVGTQFDGLGHVGLRLDDDDYFYNGFKLSEFGDAYGLKKIGVENVGVFFTRGVLIDVARYKGVERLQKGEVITASDLQNTLKEQGVVISEGDVVLIRTGHGQLWMKDNEAYDAGQPGIGLDAAKWLTEQKIVMTGSDTWANEVVPNEDPDLPYPVHVWFLVRNGIYNIENLDLEEIAHDKVYEFAFIFTPLKLKGATGSPGNPIAVR